ncbi:MAG: flagellar M-ring protein FliF [Oscillospiraceae bacterium]|nr:flagellar M-ring protein FliF [Oscillospiraceae bacterium]
MNEKIKNTVTTVKEKFSGLTKVAQVLLITVPIAVIAIIIVLVIILNQKGKAVLFSGVEEQEAGQIAAAITALGVTDVTIEDDGDIIVPEDQVDYLRMQMYMQGYPTSSTDYEIWNNGVDLWSTDSDKREVKRQQLETRIGASLASLDKVQKATVTLTTPETSDYVIIDSKGESSCSVILALKSGASLSNEEVRGIYRAVTVSAENLLKENVSIMDTAGNTYYWVDPEDDNVGEIDPSGIDVAERRLRFQKEYEELLYEDLSDMLTKAYGENGYAINVSAILDYDQKKVVSEEFVPVPGTNTGVANHEDHVAKGGNLDVDGGLVGVTNNGDNSPDYPEYIGGEEGQDYYYEKDEIQYSITNITTELNKDGYDIERLSVALMINQTNMTEADREALEEMVADAAGTTIDNVSVYNTPFVLKGSNTGTSIGGDGSVNVYTSEVDTYRDLLLFVVIGLGVLLILLLILSLFMSSSRKKKIRRKQEAALAAANNAQYSAAATSQEPVVPEEVDFNIASLTEEAGKDSRETILKREISEFAKTNPEIVASIIKNMLREE